MAERKQLARIKGTNYIGEALGPHTALGQIYYTVKFERNGLSFTSNLRADMVEVFDAPRKPIPLGFFGGNIEVRVQQDGSIVLASEGRHTLMCRKAAHELADWLYEELNNG